jgi:hypothetical protein
MEMLDIEAFDLVGGGAAAQDAAAVNANANTALAVCGTGNVASVSATGFACKK